MEQIAEERAAAKSVVQSVLERGEEVWEEEIPASWRTAGFVQEMTAAAVGILESNPPRSLSFAQLALAVASTIPPETYPSPVQAHIEGRAWKEIGTAHRYLDAYDAALRAYVAAHRSFAGECSLVHEQARAEYGRASMLILCDHHEEGLALLNCITEVFRTFGDQTLVANCEAVKAVSSTTKGDLNTALAINLRL